VSPAARKAAEFFSDQNDHRLDTKANLTGRLCGGRSVLWLDDAREPVRWHLTEAESLKKVKATLALFEKIAPARPGFSRRY